MENRKGLNYTLPPWLEWTKKDSEELVLIYIMDFYKTLDDYYLEKAVQIAKDDFVDFEKIMLKARFQLT